jgi:hypothetical protein
MPARNIKGVPSQSLGTIATVATLPAASPANAGQVAYVANCLKAAETTGTGTGNLCFSDGVAWRRVDTGATAAA